MNQIQIEAERRYPQTNDPSTALYREGCIRGFTDGAEYGERERWVSVDDALPEDGRNVLLLRDLGDHINYDTDVWGYEVMKYYKLNNYTHWQYIEPLPPAKS